MELVLLVGAPDAVDQTGQPVEDEAVYLVQPGVRLTVARRVEVREVPEQEAERVSNAPVGIGEPVEDQR